MSRVPAVSARAVNPRRSANSSAAGAYLASLLAAQGWARVWVYRFLVLVVILAIVQFLIVDTNEILGGRGPLSRY